MCSMLMLFWLTTCFLGGCAADSQHDTIQQHSFGRCPASGAIGQGRKRVLARSKLECVARCSESDRCRAVKVCPLGDAASRGDVVCRMEKKGSTLGQCLPDPTFTPCHLLRKKRDLVPDIATPARGASDFSARATVPTATGASHVVTATHEMTSTAAHTVATFADAQLTTKIAESDTTDVASAASDVTSSIAPVTSVSPDIASLSSDVASLTSEAASALESVTATHQLMSTTAQTVATYKDAQLTTKIAESDTTDVASATSNVASPIVPMASPSPDVASLTSDATGALDTQLTTKITESDTTDVASAASGVASPITPVAPPNPDIASVTSDLVSETSDVASPITPVTSQNPNIASVSSDLAPTTSDIASPTSDVWPTASDIASPTSDVWPQSSDLASPISVAASPTPELTSSTSTDASSTSTVTSDISEEATTSTEAVCANNGTPHDGVCRCPLPYVGSQCQRIMRDCMEGHAAGHSLDNVQTIWPTHALQPFKVMCTGPFTVPFWRRVATDALSWPDMTRDEATHGFGEDLNTVSSSVNFFIGLDKMLLILNQADYTNTISLLFDGWTAFANPTYTKFKVREEQDNFQLSYEGFGAGEAGGRVADNGLEFVPLFFGTNDFDPMSCAGGRGGAGWYGPGCHGYSVFASPLLWPVEGAVRQLDSVRMNLTRNSPLFF